MTRRFGPTVFPMSTTSSSPTTTTASSVARDPTDLYVTAIRDSPEVCSRCHARVRAPEHADSDRLWQAPEFESDYPDTNTLGTGDDELAPLRRARDALAGFDVEVKDDHGTLELYYLRTFCSICGRPPSMAPNSPPSRRTMMSHVAPLVDRFDEMSVPLNPDALRRAVSYLRSEPDYRGLRTEIWRAAVAVAAKHARPRDCVRCTYGSPDNDGL